jgi:signal transduction histidine kinase
MQQRRRKFIRRTVALMSVGVAALVAVIATALWAGEETRTRAMDVREAQAVKFRAELVLGRLRDAETGQRGFLLTGQGEFLEPYLEAQRVLKADIDFLAQGLADEGTAYDLSGLRANTDAKMAELATSVRLAQTQGVSAAMAEVRSGRGKVLMDNLRDELHAIVMAADDRLVVNLQALNAAALRLRVVTLVGAVLALGFGLAAVLAVRRFTDDLITAQTELSDLTHSLEDRVQARTLDLSRANEEIQRFAYIVSHDLRAPLVNVMGFTSEMEHSLSVLKTGVPQLAGEAWTSPEAGPVREALEVEMPESLDFIRSSTKRMDGLINAILRLSREGRRVLAPEPIDLKALLDQTAAAVGHQVQAREIELTVAPPMPHIVSDRLALEQVFGNLIDNAIKYLDADRPGQILVTARETGGQVVVEVADNGRGIAEPDLERIFELFRRAGRQDQPGEGIGLAHVRALVRRLGGEITVQSRLGEGSVFRVVLPRRLASEP